MNRRRTWTWRLVLSGLGQSAQVLIILFLAFISSSFSSQPNQISPSKNSIYQLKYNNSRNLSEIQSEQEIVHGKESNEIQMESQNQTFPRISSASQNTFFNSSSSDNDNDNDNDNENERSPVETCLLDSASDPKGVKMKRKRSASIFKNRVRFVKARDVEYDLGFPRRRKKRQALESKSKANVDVTGDGSNVIVDGVGGNKRNMSGGTQIKIIVDNYSGSRSTKINISVAVSGKSGKLDKATNVHIDYGKDQKKGRGGNNGIDPNPNVAPSKLSKDKSRIRTEIIIATDSHSEKRERGRERGRATMVDESTGNNNEPIQISTAKPKPRPKPKLKARDLTEAQLKEKQEAEAEAYLESIEKKYSLLCHESQIAAFNEQVGRSNERDKKIGDVANENFGELQEEIQQVIAKRFSNWKNFTNPLLRKEFKVLLQDGQGPMPDDKYERLHDLGEKMEEGFKNTFVCPYKTKNCNCPNDTSCNMQLDPEITEIFQETTDYNELEYYWTAWHNAIGSAVKSSDYEEFLMLNNEYARGNGFENYAGIWSEEYNEQTPDWTESKFRKNVLTLWEQLKPYYKILHAYVRMKLSQFPQYKGKIKRCGAIPVHLLGNMFGQSWTNVDKITKPYPDVVPLDATAEMRRQRYTPTKMLRIADEFYQSLGLRKLPAFFWNASVYVKPKKGEMVCHPAAHDLCLGRYGQDYRITMCSVVSQRDLITMHHELGHIQYAHLRYAYRGASNPGFDESVGDVLAMAVTTPEHLQCYLGLNLGLKMNCDKRVPKKHPITKTDINFLYLTALESIAFFPFAITMESWRWLIMEEKLKVKDFNNKWWEMRKDIQGVIPPKPRPPGSFDAGAKYHIVGHASYLRYFMSTVFQFDFYEALCKAAGEYNPSKPDGKPLYKCDFTGSRKAGKMLANMLKQGSRVSWPKALKELTGREYATVEPLLKYFMPLFDKLKQLLKEGQEDDCLTKPWY